MGRLVKTTPAAQEQQEEKRTVVGTGAHGRLVKTGDVQRTSPAANTAKTPTAQSVYQKALDEAMMKRAAADQKNKERGRKSYNRTHAQEVREITGDKTKKSITPIIKSAAAGYAADMVGAADTLLRAPSGLNYAASQERGEIEASKKNIAAYTEKLKTAKTEEERQQWQTLIDRNKRLIEINSKAAGEQIKNYQDATKGAQETLQGTYQKLRKTASDNMEKANEGLTPVGKYLNNVGVAGAQMAADAALGGGSALGPMFLRVFGGNSQEAAEAADKPGMSAAEQLDAQNRALLYGTASGAKHCDGEDQQRRSPVQEGVRRRLPRQGHRRCNRQDERERGGTARPVVPVRGRRGSHRGPCAASLADDLHQEAARKPRRIPQRA